MKKSCDGICEVMMVGDKRKYNVALVTLKAVGANGEAPRGRARAACGAPARVLRQGRALERSGGSAAAQAQRGAAAQCGASLVSLAYPAPGWVSHWPVASVDSRLQLSRCRPTERHSLRFGCLLLPLGRRPLSRREAPGTDQLDAGAKRVNPDVSTISGAIEDDVRSAAARGQAGQKPGSRATGYSTRANQPSLVVRRHGFKGCGESSIRSWPTVRSLLGWLTNVHLQHCWHSIEARRSPRSALALSTRVRLVLG